MSDLPHRFQKLSDPKCNPRWTIESGMVMKHSLSFPRAPNAALNCHVRRGENISQMKLSFGHAAAIVLSGQVPSMKSSGNRVVVQFEIHEDSA